MIEKNKTPLDSKKSTINLLNNDSQLQELFSKFNSINQEIKNQEEKNVILEDIEQGFENEHSPDDDSDDSSEEDIQEDPMFNDSNHWRIQISDSIDDLLKEFA